MIQAFSPLSHSPLPDENLRGTESASGKTPWTLTFYGFCFSETKLNAHQWSFLQVIRYAITLLLAKIYACAQHYFNSDQTSNFFDHPPNDFEISKLYDQVIDYEYFRDRVLTYHKGFYNNYCGDSIFALRDDIREEKFEEIMSYADQEQRDLFAGITHYEAIVDLFVDRFLARHPEMQEKQYLPVLRFVALCIAIKDSFDEAVWNEDFQKFQSNVLPLSVHNQMEIEFLKIIDWNVSVTEICAI